MFQNTIHGGAAPSLTTSVFYTGSDTLGEGYTLCYDFNAFDVNQENVTQTSPNVGEEVWADARRVLVEKCTEQNKVHFAGVVAADSDGVTGPGWVTIHRPGSICNVYTNSDVDSESPTSGTEGAGTAQGELVNVVVDQYYMKRFGFPGCGAAMVLQDVNRGTTAGTVMCELMTGLPSGGINVLAAMTSLHNGVASSLGTLFSNLLGYVPSFTGVYIGTDGALTDVILSVKCLAADGRFAEQRWGLFNSTFISTSMSCIISQVRRSGTTIVGAQNFMVTSMTHEISAAGEYLVMEFDGYAWTLIGGHQSLISV